MHIFLLILLIAAIGLGVYLVQNRTNIFPRAASEPIGPETSFTLKLNKIFTAVGDTFVVDVLVSSDFDETNTFSALISYPADKLEVVGIEPPINPPQNGVPSSIPLTEKEDASFLSQIIDTVSTKVEAQTQTPMPPLSGSSVCVENTPRVALSWNSDLNPDVLNWDIFRQPPFAGSQQVFVGNYTLPFNTPKVGRIEYPLLDQGDAGGTYTYYLEGAAGQSNKVTVTNNAICSNNSQLVEASVPAQVQPGAQFNVKYTYKNTGTKVWPSSSMGFIYGPEVELKLISNSSFSPASNELKKKTSSGIDLSVYPGQSYTFEFPVTAPANAGTYDFNWQMSAKGTNFGEVSKKQIVVGSIASPSPSATTTPQPDKFFIKKWTEQSDDKNGNIVLSGSVPNPGFKTTAGRKALMAKITFKAKANGDALVDFKGDSAIFRNSDNQNILSITRGVTINIGATQSATPEPSGSLCRAIACNAGSGCSYSGGFTSTCNPAEYDKLTCGNLICVEPPTPSSTPLPPTVDGKRADLYKDLKKPGFVNDQDISVFYSKCAEKGIELFGEPASRQPICDIFEDGKITVQDWAVLLKFRNQTVGL